MARAIFTLLLVLVTPAHADADAEALEYLDKGVEAYNAGRLHAARELFALAHERAPDKANPFRWLALVDGKLGRCAEALVELDQFLDRVPVGDPRSAELYELRDRCRHPPPQIVIVAPPVQPRPAPVLVPRAPPPATPARSEPPPRRRYWIAGVVVGAVAVVALAVGLGVGLGTRGGETTLPPLGRN